MCTAITFETKDFYFGRNLDYDISYDKRVCILPRNYTIKLRKEKKKLSNHYAMIGMAYVKDGYPLYFDACNEKGLAIAALNFVGNAYFPKNAVNKEKICQFEFIPFLLASCQSIEEVKEKLANLAILDFPFDKDLPTASLHYLISDGKQTIVVEPQKEGIMVYDNSIGVLTNNPPFPIQRSLLNYYMNLSIDDPKNTFAKQLSLKCISRGMGGLGLPGDLSSSSRFIRASFVKLNSITKKDEVSSVNQFFHILSSVEQQRGLTRIDGKTYEITLYTACMNLTKGFYYYTTYENHQITKISLYEENLEDSTLLCYPLIETEQIRCYNEKKL